MALVDADMRFVAEDWRSDLGHEFSIGPFFRRPRFSVQRASWSFCASLAGLMA